jgi:hypothetical protein
MVELDLTYFGGRDACDLIKRDIDHRNTLLGLPLSDEFTSYPAEHPADPRRHVHSLPVLYAAFATLRWPDKAANVCCLSSHA